MGRILAEDINGQTRLEAERASQLSLTPFLTLTLHLEPTLNMYANFTGYENMCTTSAQTVKL